MSQAATRGRVHRGLVFAGVTVVLAVGAHWLGSGMVAPPWVLVGSVLTATVVGWLVVPRRTARTVILTSVGAQLLLHCVFCLSMSRGMDPLAMLTCGQHRQAAPLTPPLLVWHQSSLLTRLVGARGVPMLLTHAAAAALAGWWMHTGERLATELGCALVAALMPVWRLMLPRPIPPVYRRRCQPPASPAVVLCMRRRPVGAFGLRGPPPMPAS